MLQTSVEKTHVLTKIEAYNIGPDFIITKSVHQFNFSLHLNHISY